VRIDLVAYAGDCRVWGEFDLDGDRLSDALNASDSLLLRNAVLEGLDDGRLVEVDEVALDRNDLYVVAARGPRGNSQRRIHTVPQRLEFLLGPYRVLGQVHGRPGMDSLAQLTRRPAMVPITNATIAYQIAGGLRVQDAGTIIINRDLAQEVRAADSFDRWAAKDYTWALE
jgi:hypothetical protein